MGLPKNKGNFSQAIDFSRPQSFLPWSLKASSTIIPNGEPSPTAGLLGVPLWVGLPYSSLETAPVDKFKGWGRSLGLTSGRMGGDRKLQGATDSSHLSSLGPQFSLHNLGIWCKKNLLEHLPKSNTQAVSVSLSTVLLLFIIEVIWLKRGGGGGLGRVQESPTLYGFNILADSGYIFRCWHSSSKGS